MTKPHEYRNRVSPYYALTTGATATAKLYKSNMELMDILLSLAHIEIDIALVIFTAVGLFEAFVVAKTKMASGETSFLAYRRAFISFGTAFISGIVTGLMAEPPDAIATGIGVLNAIYLFFFLLQVWIKTTSD